MTHPIGPPAVGVPHVTQPAGPPPVVVVVVGVRA